MAILKVNYQCGCGFTTTEPLKAHAHSDERHHSLTVSGWVHPGVPREPSKTPAASRPVAKQAPAPQESVSTEISASLAELRRRLRK